MLGIDCPKKFPKDKPTITQIKPEIKDIIKKGIFFIFVTPAKNGATERINGINLAIIRVKAPYFAKNLFVFKKLGERRSSCFFTYLSILSSAKYPKI